METKSVKEAAQQLIDQLPENSTWDDLMQEIYVRQAIETGLADSESGKVFSVEEVRSTKLFNIPQM
jgi:predicted transcriptional regulator